ncbi:predicted protein [Naegleria gruberi]|uniref:Predicted protein n=1 Tax=Naegleria gruberi TaxID=5762 RepID=D2W0S0_NAEGR|nr:uncharacterized protein NAEGRDRAFT_74958 [Naegleria gruberi]EFC37384.1 predicted protein [Naegleria gruberi]|eukprot:XP_002670128.1 predicted protein [Naegleria gruberi strain NEG-M]
MFFGARRQKHYQSGSEANSLDAVSKKIAEDVRKEIKDMKHPSLFSKEWVVSCDLIEKITKVVLMEREDLNFEAITAKLNKDESKKIEEDKHSETSSIAVNDEQGNDHSSTQATTSSGATSATNTSLDDIDEEQPVPKTTTVRPGTASLINNPRKKKSNIQFGSSTLHGSTFSNTQKKPPTSPSRPSTSGSSIISSSTHSSVNHKQQAITTSFSGDQTLWDRDEYCIRFIVEEGKLNMLLRILDEFKDEQAKITGGQKTMQEVLTTSDIKDETELTNKMNKFEMNLAVLMMYSFHSLESLQTLDMYQTLDLINKNMNTKTFLDNKLKLGDDVYKTTEYLVIDYLRSLFVHIEKLDESKISNLTIERKLLPKLIQFLEKTVSHMGEHEIIRCFETISAIAAAETFQTSREKYFGSDKDVKMALVKMYDTHVKKLLNNYDRKKSLRSLIDIVNRIKIEYGLD